MINYGHTSNTTYFTFYGLVLDCDDYCAAAFVMRFGEDIPRWQLKLKLLHKEQSKAKLSKFYYRYERRQKCNARFMAFCRFFWSDGDERFLCSVPDVATLG